MVGDPVFVANDQHGPWRTAKIKRVFEEGRSSWIDTAGGDVLIFFGGYDVVDEGGLSVEDYKYYRLPTASSPIRSPASSLSSLDTIDGGYSKILANLREISALQLPLEVRNSIEDCIADLNKQMVPTLPSFLSSLPTISFF